MCRISPDDHHTTCTYIPFLCKLHRLAVKRRRLLPRLAVFLAAALPTFLPTLLFRFVFLLDLSTQKPSSHQPCENYQRTHSKPSAITISMLSSHAGVADVTVSHFTHSHHAHPNSQGSR